MLGVSCWYRASRVRNKGGDTYKKSCLCLCGFISGCGFLLPKGIKSNVRELKGLEKGYSKFSFYGGSITLPFSKKLKDLYVHAKIITLENI